MASWSESASYQGAASGAAVGTVVGGAGVGTAVGAGVGFIAGGLIGGAQEDAAREAEEQRQKEIQRAIERQNTADFNAKAQAEQWAIADIGINKDDRVQDARANADGLENNLATNSANQSKIEKKLGNIQDANSPFLRKLEGKYVKKLKDAEFNTGLAKNAVAANEGIISSYEKDMGAPKKY
jgi:hypothetical protein